MLKLTYYKNKIKNKIKIILFKNDNRYQRSGFNNFR